MPIPNPTCACQSAAAQFDQFRIWRPLDPDMTNGRYADVEIEACVTCGQLWLRYFVEYEAFSKSGRWARGVIDEAAAMNITPNAAPNFLARLPSYLFGGSYFDGKSGSRSGPIKWDL
jgi:hypothetical protein